MGSESTVLLKEDVEQLTALCAQLHRDSNSKTIVLIDKSGQYIASSGHVAELDLTSLASLTAGNMAATSGLAELIGEADFPNVFHEGQRESMHLSLVSDRAILVVVFDRRTSLGLVRLRVKKMTDAMGQVFDTVTRRGADAQGKNPLAEMTDDDLDKLFDA